MLDMGQSMGVSIVGTKDDMMQNIVELEKRDTNKKGEVNGSMRREQHAQCQ